MRRQQFIEWLSESASNVSFYKSYSFTAFELSIRQHVGLFETSDFVDYILPIPFD